MKFFTFAAVLFAAATQACDLYSNCICVTAEGIPDKNATEIACQDQTEPHKELRVRNNITECHFNGAVNTGFLGMEKNGLDNCRFRESCTEAGATGPDSSCSGAFN
ncbi:hypothetical protein DHEL01_v206449 [Diaporthe helianthi]|uniref:Cyanovirin-N domain-containing protein n=1 Tax=Diaporthe helianthi TaxID=158607 RepID=A0A2P5HY42_DIAHE|nr:hypothetical protein DHEL01_v206449 [Diaporthe helianthi]